MKLYADTAVRRTRQMVGDLSLVIWVLLWTWVGRIVHDTTMTLAGPGRRTDEAASSMAEGLRDAGGRIDDAPLVGDELSAPFDKAASASDGIAAAGRDTVEAVERLALVLGWAVALIPILVALAVYLPGRWRFAQEATAGARLIDAHEDLDLFALRALANQPVRVLAKVSDDPAGDWRRRDTDVVRRLAELELADAGLRPRRPLSVPGRSA